MLFVFFKYGEIAVQPAADCLVIVFRRIVLTAFCLAWLQAGATEPDSEGPVILVLGDSLSAGYGIDPQAGWVALLARRLKETGRPHKVVNGSISGDTTRGGLERSPFMLRRVNPDIVIVELGGNDGLRGVAPRETEKNLRHIVRLIRAHGAGVLLVGMRLPPNLGDEYTQRFESIFADLSAELRLPLVPFLLDGVATKPEYMQADGIHPRANAQGALLQNVWLFLQPLLSVAGHGVLRNP